MWLTMLDHKESLFFCQKQMHSCAWSNVWLTAINWMTLCSPLWCNAFCWNLIVWIPELQGRAKILDSRSLRSSWVCLDTQGAVGMVRPIQNGDINEGSVLYSIRIKVNRSRSQFCLDLAPVGCLDTSRWWLNSLCSSWIERMWHLEAVDLSKESASNTY